MIEGERLSLGPGDQHEGCMLDKTAKKMSPSGRRPAQNKLERSIVRGGEPLLDDESTQTSLSILLSPEQMGGA